MGWVRCWPEDGGQGTGPVEYRTGKTAGDLARARHRAERLAALICAALAHAARRAAAGPIFGWIRQRSGRRTGDAQPC